MRVSQPTVEAGAGFPGDRRALGARGPFGAPDMEEEMAVRGAAFRASLDGRRVLVVGMAKSGVAAAALCRACGARVLATDAKALDALGPEARALPASGVGFVSDPAAALAATDLVVVSP